MHEREGTVYAIFPESSSLEKPVYPRFEPRAGIKMVQVLGCPLYIHDNNPKLFRMKKYKKNFSCPICVKFEGK